MLNGKVKVLSANELNDAFLYILQIRERLPYEGTYPWILSQ